MTLGTAVILLVLAVAGIVLIFKYLCKVSAKFSCGFIFRLFHYNHGG